MGYFVLQLILIFIYLVNSHFYLHQLDFFLLPFFMMTSIASLFISLNDKYSKGKGFEKIFYYELKIKYHIFNVAFIGIGIYFLCKAYLSFTEEVILGLTLSNGAKYFGFVVYYGMGLYFLLNIIFKYFNRSFNLQISNDDICDLLLSSVKISMKSIQSMEITNKYIVIAYGSSKHYIHTRNLLSYDKKELIHMMRQSAEKHSFVIKEAAAIIG